MMRYFRELRLLPIAVIASSCLLVLVAADLILGGHAATSDEELANFADAAVVHAAPATARLADQRSWAQQMFNFPDRKNVAAERNDMAFLPAIPPLAADRSKTDIVTGSVSERGAAKGDKRKAKRSSPPPTTRRVRSPGKNRVKNPVKSPPTRTAPRRSRRIRRWRRMGGWCR